MARCYFDLVIAVIQIELYGLIHWIELKLNAVTMVNLIMTVGISIEFVIHEARAFAEAKGTRPQRAQALSEMGPVIFASAFHDVLGDTSDRRRRLRVFPDIFLSVCTR